jgi:large subunit ribosomal protein L24
MIVEDERAMAGIKIKRNDKVEVIAGKDKGKQGRVLRVIAEKNRVLVEGVMMVKKHMKPNPQKNIQGGIAEQESTIHISNVMLVDAEGNKTRIGSRLEGEKKVRFSKTSGNTIPEKKK